MRSAKAPLSEIPFFFSERDAEEESVINPQFRATGRICPSKKSYQKRHYEQAIRAYSSGIVASGLEVMSLERCSLFSVDGGFCNQRFLNTQFILGFLRRENIPFHIPREYIFEDIGAKRNRRNRAVVHHARFAS